MHTRRYTRYVNNFDEAEGKLKKITASEAKEDKEKLRYLTGATKHPDARGQTLGSYLIQPVQRVLRYPMLLEELLANTEESHPDTEPLREALGLTREVAKSFNENKRVTDDFARLRTVFARFCDADASRLRAELLSYERRFLREGSLVKARLSHRQKRFLMLFNDVLLYSQVHVHARARHAHAKHACAHAHALLMLFNDVLLSLAGHLAQGAGAQGTHRAARRRARRDAAQDGGLPVRLRDRRQGRQGVHVARRVAGGEGRVAQGHWRRDGGGGAAGGRRGRLVLRPARDGQDEAAAGADLRRAGRLHAHQVQQARRPVQPAVGVRDARQARQGRPHPVGRPALLTPNPPHPNSNPDPNPSYHPLPQPFLSSLALTLPIMLCPGPRWGDPKSKECKSEQRLQEATALLHGAKSSAFFKQQGSKRDMDSLCFSVVFKERTLDFAATTADQLIDWYLALAALIPASSEPLLNEAQLRERITGMGLGVG